MLSKCVYYTCKYFFFQETIQKSHFFCILYFSSILSFIGLTQKKKKRREVSFIAAFLAVMWRVTVEIPPCIHNSYHIFHHLSRSLDPLTQRWMQEGRIKVGKGRKTVVEKGRLLKVKPFEHRYNLTSCYFDLGMQNSISNFLNSTFLNSTFLNSTFLSST